MNLEDVRWIMKIFELKNMSRAAEALYVTQPALSHCLKKVENRLGFALFERSNKGLTPTEKGLRFFQAARKLMDSYRQFQTQIDLLNLTDLVRIVIGMGPYLSECCSAELLKRLNDTYPGISFSIREENFDGLMSALNQNEIQMLVATCVYEYPGLNAHTYRSTPGVIFLRKESDAAAYIWEDNGIRYLDPRHLKHEPLALTRPGQASRRMADSVIREAGFVPDIVHESRYIATLYKHALEGNASAIVPLTSREANEDISNGLICRIPETYYSSSCTLTILTLPALNALLPEGIYEIIRETVESNHLYSKPLNAIPD